MTSVLTGLLFLHHFDLPNFFRMNFVKKKAGKMSFTKKTSYARGNNFLHGQLLIKIISAENLPDLEGIFRVTIDIKNHRIT